MEVLIVLAIILLFFGAKRVPELGRSLGRGMRELRKGASEDPDNDELGERKENEDLSPREKAPPEQVRGQTEHKEVFSTDQRNEQKP